jgi:threonine/homoserine/homoserine lactone efflux protein
MKRREDMTSDWYTMMNNADIYSRSFLCILTLLHLHRLSSHYDGILTASVSRIMNEHIDYSCLSFIFTTFMLPFVFGTLLGFILAIPPGPIAVAVMKSGLNDDIKRAEAISIGTALLDAVYCGCLLLATSALASLFSHWEHHFGIAYRVFQVLCVAGVIIYGIISIRTHHTVEEIEHQSQPQEHFVEALQTRVHSHNGFWVGIGIALANLANPTFIPSLTYTTVMAQNYNLTGTTFSDHALFSLGFGLGAFLWLTLVAQTIHRYKHTFSANIINTLNRFAGLTMIGFGTYLGLRIFAII